MIDAAIILGVTQREIENDFYMVDIPKFIQSKTKQKALTRLEEIRLILATNNRAVEDDVFDSLMRSLTKTAGIDTTMEFDRDKFEQLRMLQSGFSEGR